MKNPLNCGKKSSVRALAFVVVFLLLALMSEIITTTCWIDEEIQNRFMYHIYAEGNYSTLQKVRVIKILGT